MPLIQIENLSREALNYAVALATDRPVVVLSGGTYGNPDCLKYAALPNGARYSPTTNWAQGGPLMDEEAVGTVGAGPFGTFTAISLKGNWFANGSTWLEAVCRLVVLLKFPEGVEVPNDLL